MNNVNDAQGTMDPASLPLLEMIAVIILGAFVLLLPTLANGFPFIDPDSRDYLFFEPQVLYRSPFYGLLIALFHLKRFIWAPVAMQALVASHLIWLIVSVSGTKQVIRDFAICIVILTACSTLPFGIGVIMADVFTPIMMLTMYLIAFCFYKFGVYLRFYLLGLDCVATAVHLANWLLAIPLVIMLLILLLWCGRSYVAALRQVKLLLIPVAFSVTLLFINNAIHHEFTLSPDGKSFFMANLINNGGPADKYLREACPQAGYKLCAYIDKFPMTSNDILWKAYFEIGSFNGMRQESRAIVIATIKKYPMDVARVMINNTETALLSWSFEGPGAMDQLPDMPLVLGNKFGPKATQAYLNSLQMRDLLPHQLIKSINYIAVTSSFVLLMIFIIFYIKMGNRENASLAVFAIASFLCNTTICASFSGVFDRYQSRVTWLFIFAAIVLAIRFFERLPKHELVSMITPQQAS